MVSTRYRSPLLRGLNQASGGTNVAGDEGDPDFSAFEQWVNDDGSVEWVTGTEADARRRAKAQQTGFTRPSWSSMAPALPAQAPIRSDLFATKPVEQVQAQAAAESAKSDGVGLNLGAGLKEALRIVRSGVGGIPAPKEGESSTNFNYAEPPVEAGKYLFNSATVPQKPIISPYIGLDDAGIQQAKEGEARGDVIKVNPPDVSALGVAGTLSAADDAAKTVQAAATLSPIQKLSQALKAAEKATPEQTAMFEAQRAQRTAAGASALEGGSGAGALPERAFAWRG